MAELFDPPDDANEALFDALVRHQVYIMRLSQKVRQRIERILNATEADLATKIRDRLRNAQGLTSPTETARLESLLGIIRNVRTKAWSEVNAAWAEELVELSKAEPELLARMIAATSPVVVDTVLPPARTLRSIALSRPFEGRILRDWASSIQAEDLRRIENAVRVGLIQGEPSDAIARRVVGSARLNGADGVTEISRRQAAALTRTAVNHVANHARRAFLQENQDLFEQELYVATLDNRTTPVCRGNDGKKFPAGKGPQPPLHFNCRSLRVPVMGGEKFIQRPAKPTTEKSLLREFAKKKGLSKVPATRKGLPRGTKTEFDKFKQKRVREMTGRVPATTSYQQWLMRQSKEFQEDVLGVTKARLFRQGKLKLDRFVNRNGDELNLSELARREADAFRAAGLDPDDFK